MRELGTEVGWVLFLCLVIWVENSSVLLLKLNLCDLHALSFSVADTVSREYSLNSTKTKARQAMCTLGMFLTINQQV